MSNMLLEFNGKTNTGYVLVNIVLLCFQSGFVPVLSLVYAGLSSWASV